MLSFTPLFEAAKNKKTGSAPVWILKIPFVAGTVYLSDRIFTITNWDDPPIVTLPLIARWGTIDDDISNGLSMPIVSDFSVDIIIDPNAASSIHDLLRGEPVGKLRCVLYQWDSDLDAATDPPFPRWTGNISNISQKNELYFQVDLVDEGASLDKYVGNVLSLADYPLCDLNKVGYQLPIIYGIVEGAPLIGLDVADQTTLPSTISGGGSALTMGSTTSRVAHGAFSYEIAGVMYEKAADSVGIVPGNDALVRFMYGAVAFDIGADGVVDAIEATNQVAAQFATAPEAVAALPACASDHVRMGYVTAAAWPVGAGFTFGSTGFADAYTDVAFVSSLTEQSDFYLSAVRGIAAGDTIIIEDEEIYITTLSGAHIIACTRGYNSTAIVHHQAGTMVRQKKLDVVFMFADHSVKTISKIYGMTSDGVAIDITNRCTIYTGQTGSELAGYEGKAVITVPAVMTTEVYACTALPKTLSQTVPSATGTYATPDSTGSVTEKYYLIYFTCSVSENPDTASTSGDFTGITLNAYRLNGSSHGNGGYMLFPASFKLSYSGTPTQAIIITWSAVVDSLPSPGGKVTFYLQAAGGVTIATWEYTSAGLIASPGASPASVAWGGVSGIVPGNISLTCSATAPFDGDISLTVSAIHADQSATGAATTLSITVGGSPVTIGTVDTTGWHPSITSPHKVAETGTWNTGSIAIVYSGGQLLGGTSSLKIDKVEMCQTREIAPELSKDGVPNAADGEGYQDDGSGTFTGTPNALIELPDHVFRHFLNTYPSPVVAVADFVTDAATPFAAKGYKFAMVIKERKQIKEWLAYMARQCRCWFRFANAKAYLLYRPDSLASVKTITSGMTAMNDDYTTTVVVGESPRDELINVINLCYKRDWSLAEGRSAYQAILRDTDPVSIAAYGEKEQPDLFLFDFVRDDAMAADLLAFFLARYAYLKKEITLEAFMVISDIEFADGVTLAALGNLLCEVLKAGAAPGYKDSLDMINLTVREY